MIKSNDNDMSSTFISETAIVASTISSINEVINFSESAVVASKSTIVASKSAVVVSKQTAFISIFSTNNEITNFRFDLRFKYRNDLIYFTAENDRERFCISASLKQKVFQLIHDQTHHEDFHRIYDRICYSIITSIV